MSDERSMRVDYRGRTVVITARREPSAAQWQKPSPQTAANVAIGCRNLGKGRELAERIRKAGGTAEVFSMEVTDPAGLKTAAAEIEAKFGAIHVLINNAGVNVGPGGSETDS